MTSLTVLQTTAAILGALCIIYGMDLRRNPGARSVVAFVWQTLILGVMSAFVSRQPGGVGPPPSRRTFLGQSLASAGWLSFSPARTLAAEPLLIANVTGLYSVQVARIETPHSTDDVAALVGAWPGQVPYQLHATKQQFESAYPEVVHLRRLKLRVDPTGKFSNELWRKYL